MLKCRFVTFKEQEVIFLAGPEFALWNLHQIIFEPDPNKWVKA